MHRDHVVVVGSHVQGLFMRVPRFPTADETVLGWGYKEAHDGGKGSHQAIACARLGLRTYFVGRVGKDRLGEIGAGWMREAGVDLTYLARSEKTPTGCGFVMINPSGVPAITTAMGANEEMSTFDIDHARPILANAKIVLITFEIPIATGLYAARLAKELGAFTILTPGPAEPLDPGALAGVDLLVPNENEAKTLTGTPLAESVSCEQLGRKLRDRFGQLDVVITMGDRGAYVVTGEFTQKIGALKVNGIADTAGAGDAFTAGLAYGFVGGWSLTESVSFGCLTAARAITIKESIPGFGTLAEVSEFASSHGFALHGVNLGRHAT
jgi:ribokinase